MKDKTLKIVTSLKIKIVIDPDISKDQDSDAI